LREKRRVLPALTVEPYANVDSAICCEPDVDLLILDGPGNAPTATMEIASVAHLVVQPSGACFDDLQPAADLFYQLQGLGIPKSRLYIALSRMLSEAEEAAARAYIDVAGFSALPGVLIERIRYREAHNQGLAFIESPGEDLAAPAAATLSSLLTKIMRKHRALQPAPRKQPPALPPPAAEQRALVRS
jgi:chromosome partitioning protein